jgi:hypothetical protein
MACPKSKNGPKKGLRPLGVKVGKLNSADAKFREYTSKFSFLPCKKKIRIFFYLKNSVVILRIIFLPILPLDYGMWSHTNHRTMYPMCTFFHAGNVI